MSEKDELSKSTENHRFQLAMLFIGGFLVITLFALIGEMVGTYSGVKDLAAIFGGWITSVVAFYFLQQNTEKAQQQVEKATEDARDARKQSEKSKQKTERIANITQTDILELNQLQTKLEEKIEKQNEKIRQQSGIILELLAKLKDFQEQSKSENNE